MKDTMYNTILLTVRVNLYYKKNVCLGIFINYFYILLHKIYITSDQVFGYITYDHVLNQ